MCEYLQSFFFLREEHSSICYVVLKYLGREDEFRVVYVLKSE